MAQVLGLLGVGKAATATLSTISTIAAPVLSVAGAVSGVQAGKAQQAEFNRQARDERVTASIRGARERRTARIQQSRDRLTMLEGGSLSGTAFDLLRQNQTATELDVMTGIYEGEQRARSAEARGRASRKSPLTVFSAAIDGFNQVDPLNIGGQV